jgi:uncharacterized Zn finger protein
MVHFTSKLEVIQMPTAPPVCPKCGSHRTEIIGKVDDPAKRTVRCNTCGAISTVPVNGQDALNAGAISAA